jgi:DNA gyrase subunit A
VAGLRRCQRGDLGQIGLRFEQREDQLIDLRPGSADLVAGLLSDGRSLRLATAALIAEDPGGSGMALPLNPSDRLNALVPLGL